MSSNSDASFRLFLPCASGMEVLLRDEVLDILQMDLNRVVPAPHTCAQHEILVTRGGVALEGSMQTVMLLNLKSRLAQRVLIELSCASYRNEQDLYESAAEVAWERWFAPEQTFKVSLTAQRSPIKSLNFAALKIKDAVCDRMRRYFDARPSVDTHSPDVAVFAHLSAQLLTLYIDTTGEPLFKRGWRHKSGDAPLKETLAAAMLAAARWKEVLGQGAALYDPCCGSGTIAIEAAQIACDIAPGLNRYFAFEKFLHIDLSAWPQLREKCLRAVHPSPVAIYASDVSHRMVDFARQNAQAAGPNGIVARAIEFRGGDVLERMPPAKSGILLLNPPYGERIATGGQGKNTTGGEDFFVRLAAHWKKHFAGWNAFVLSPDLKLPATMRLQASRRTPLWNGPIECRLFHFEMRAGNFES